MYKDFEEYSNESIKSYEHRLGVACKRAIKAIEQQQIDTAREILNECATYRDVLGELNFAREAIEGVD